MGRNGMGRNGYGPKLPVTVLSGSFLGSGHHCPYSRHLHPIEPPLAVFIFVERNTNNIDWYFLFILSIYLSIYAVPRPRGHSRQIRVQVDV